MIRGVVFDIDDTLYDERDYVRSGFAHVARRYAGSEVEERALADWLWTAFEAGVRGDTFARLIDAFPDLAGRTSVPELVDAYRNHPPAIRLTPEVATSLDALADRGVRLGIISDGPAESQSAKAAALGLGRWFEPIILTSALGPGFAKPAPGAFEAIARAWSIGSTELAYVADNPAKDFAGPRALGWLTVRVRHPGQLRFDLEPARPSDRADFEISAAADLPGRLGFDGTGSQGSSR